MPLFVVFAALGCRHDLPMDDTAAMDSGTAGTAALVFPTAVPEECTACGGDCTADSFDIVNARHVRGGVDYPDPPPAGGPHDPCWAPWGVHTRELRDENWVHNLEHGGIVMLYDCPAGCDADVASIAAIVDRAGVWAVSTPYSLMSHPYAIVAWGHRLQMGCADTDAMKAFFAEHVNHAPESEKDDPPEACANEWGDTAAP